MAAKIKCCALVIFGEMITHINPFIKHLDCTQMSEMAKNHQRNLEKYGLYVSKSLSDLPLEEQQRYKLASKIVK